MVGLALSMQIFAFLLSFITLSIPRFRSLFQIVRLVVIVICDLVGTLMIPAWSMVVPLKEKKKHIQPTASSLNFSLIISTSSTEYNLSALQCPSCPPGHVFSFHSTAIPPLSHNSYNFWNELTNDTANSFHTSEEYHSVRSYSTWTIGFVQHVPPKQI